MTPAEVRELLALAGAPMDILAWSKYLIAVDDPATIAALCERWLEAENDHRLYAEDYENACRRVDKAEAERDALRADAELLRRAVAFADMVRQATHPSPASWAHYDQARAAIDAAKVSAAQRQGPVQ